jgi:hypothetical protein
MKRQVLFIAALAAFPPYLGAEVGNPSQNLNEPLFNQQLTRIRAHMGSHETQPAPKEIVSHLKDLLTERSHSIKRFT